MQYKYMKIPIVPYVVFCVFSLFVTYLLIPDKLSADIKEPKKEIVTREISQELYTIEGELNDIEDEMNREIIREYRNLLYEIEEYKYTIYTARHILKSHVFPEDEKREFILRTNVAKLKLKSLFDMKREIEDAFTQIKPIHQNIDYAE